MVEAAETDLNVFLKNIQKQFLCCYPLHCILWQEFPKHLSWDEQKALMDHTFLSSLNDNFPIKLSYQLNFLKKLLLFLEKTCSEVHDIYYETYCRLQQNLASDCTKKYAFKHYIVKPGVNLTLRESRSFVTDGTTGLCSWQASLALADFFTKTQYVLKDKVVLELGAGTGLCGLTILKTCQPKHLILSDGSISCVELMRENLKRNFPEALEENHRFQKNSIKVECLLVPWQSIENKVEILVFKPNIIVAADVVYDVSNFKDLSSAIDFVFKLNGNNVQMYLAATVRNESTLNAFIDIMEALNFQITECGVVPLEESNFYWDRSTPLKILKFTR